MIKKIFFAFLLFLSFVSVAYAADTLDVQFETTPLFQRINITPGYFESRHAIVRNISNKGQSISAKVTVLVPVDSGPVQELSDVIDFQIKREKEVLFDGTLTDFFNNKEVFLDFLAPGASLRYDFIASFRTNAGNYYQAKTAVFDIQIRAEDVNNQPNFITTQTSGSSSPFDSKVLLLNVTSQGLDTSALIKFDVNAEGKSFVYYAKSGSLAIYDPDDETYGYTNVVNADVEGKSVEFLLSDLEKDTKYAYRIGVVSDQGTILSEERYVQTGKVAGLSEDIRVNKQADLVSQKTENNKKCSLLNPSLSECHQAVIGTVLFLIIITISAVIIGFYRYIKNKTLQKIK